MKFKLTLFVVIVFLTVNETQAQPSPYRAFSPNDHCLSFAKDEVIFLGRLVSFNWVPSSSLISDSNDGSSTLKVTISVKKILNGKLDKKENIEIFTKVFRPGLQEGDTRIFVASEFINSHNIKFLVTDRWSQTLSVSNEKDQSNIFSNIHHKLKEVLISAIIGRVVQQKVNPSFLNASFLNPNLNDSNVFHPMEGIKIKAIRIKDGKSFQTKTDADGRYKFLDLAEGAYEIRLISPKGFQEVDNGYRNIIYKIQNERERNRCYRQVFFELKQIN
jgi:hypothetical protein